MIEEDVVPNKHLGRMLAMQQNYYSNQQQINADKIVASDDQSFRSSLEYFVTSKEQAMGNDDKSDSSKSEKKNPQFFVITKLLKCQPLSYTERSIFYTSAVVSR
jgi:hypothetical protein